MRELAGFVARISELERRLANVVRHGTVAEVDVARGVRLRLGGTDAEPFLGPWVPYGQSAGALKVHTPPSVGQQMTVFSPAGDFRQGMAVPMAWSAENPSPSGATDENVVTFGGVTIKLTGEAVEIAIGGVKVTISGTGLAIDGGEITHNGHKIDDSHKHTGVQPGGGKSGPPE